MKSTQPPQPLTALVGRPIGFGALDVDELLDRADAQYWKQTVEGIEEAERLWTTAAASDASRTEGLIGMARAGVWLTGHLEDSEARARCALRAVQAAQWCAVIEPKNPACAYWLGAALGVQARERPSTGLDALKQIEAAFMRAAADDPGLEQGGPDRALALLYLRAPGWPAGPGDPDKGLAHAHKAVDLNPDYPPNQLALAEALAVTGDMAGCRAAYQTVLVLTRPHPGADGTDDVPIDPEAAAWAEEARQGLKSRGL